MLKSLKIFFNCKLMGSHSWTSAAGEGKPPTSKQIEDGVDGFIDYATMYCKDCGKISDLVEKR